MNDRPSHPDDPQTIRAMRLRIGRLRRQIDGRLHETLAEGRRLASWRVLAARRTGVSSFAAFGAGLAAGFSFSRLSRRITSRVVEEGLAKIRQTAINQWRHFCDRPSRPAADARDSATSTAAAASAKENRRD